MSSPSFASPEELIIAALLESADVAAIVGARVYPDFLGQKIALPAIVTQRAATEYVNVIHGAPPVASTVRMDSYCLGGSRLAAEKLADEVVIALADAGFLVTDRRQDFDEDTGAYITIVTCDIFQV